MDDFVTDKRFRQCEKGTNGPIVFVLFALLVFCQITLADSGYSQLLTFTKTEPLEIGGPVFTLNIASGIQMEKLLVVLDKTDISEMIDITAGGFKYLTADRLAAGSHQLLVIASTRDGMDIRKEFGFTISKAEVKNLRGRITSEITARGLAYDDANNSPQDYEVDAYLNSELNWHTAGWTNNFSGDFWYLDQTNDLDPFTQRQPQVVSYLFSTKGQLGNGQFDAKIGDVELNHSRNTLSYLNRRGANAKYQQDNWQLSAFSVNSSQSIGFEDGTGVGTDSDDTLVGMTVNIKLNKDNRLSAIYMGGGEQQNTLGGFSTSSNPKEGRVLGLLLDSKLFNNNLSLEAEFNQSNFDNNSSDTTDGPTDNAYGLRLSGQGRWYNYRASYEFTGKDYAVIANPFVLNDRKILSLSSNLYRNEHNVSLGIQILQNNVDHDNSRATLNNTGLTADYSYKQGREFVTGITLYRVSNNSSDEPTASDKVDQETLGTRLHINYNRGRWFIHGAIVQSKIDDALNDTKDSDIKNYSISPGWQDGQTFIFPSYYISETTFNGGLPTVENSVFSVNIRGQGFRQKLTYQFSGIWNRQESAGNTVDIFSNELNVDYLLREGGVRKHRISTGVLVQQYENITKITASQQDDSLIWFHLTVGLPVTF